MNFIPKFSMPAPDVLFRGVVIAVFRRETQLLLHHSPELYEEVIGGGGGGAGVASSSSSGWLHGWGAWGLG